MTDRDPDAIITNVLARFHEDDEPERNRSHRAVVVLDGGVAVLEAALKEADLTVIVVDEGVETLERRALQLAGRILVTRNTPAFLDDAPALGYGIIGLDAMPAMDEAPAYEDNETARMISRVVSEYRLPSYRSGWVLLVHPQERHRFRRLE